jgi:hypothetical protein
MRSFTRTTAAVIVCLGWCLFAASTNADPVLLSVNADFLDTSFDNDGGTYGLGVLTVDDNADIVVIYNTDQETYIGGHFSLTTDLFSDDSTGGVASGDFKGGSFTITDNESNTLLSGDISDLGLDEVVAQPDHLAGLGAFTVTGGSLSSEFSWGVGEIVHLLFDIDPADIDDFGGDFGGQSDVALEPIPEPATFLLVGSAVLGLIGIRWRRRMKS